MTAGSTKRFSLGALLAALLLAAGCASLGPPQPEPWSDEPSTRERASSALGTRIDQLVADYRAGAPAGPEASGRAKRSGIHPLAGGREAFAVRLRLIESAEQTLDLQYYIWRDDLSGRMMFDAVRRAADRGVRVRLLIDDNNTAGMDDLLAWLDEHPRIEVRLFNPFAQRRWRALGYLTAFDRLHRRMHNKSLTSDGRATIIGGRNIGDTYFDATDETAFADMDVLALGPIVGDVSADFERYWRSQAAYPVRQLTRPLDDARRGQIIDRLRGVGDSPDTAYYREALERTRALADLREGRLDLNWAPVTMLSDPPSKIVDRDRPTVSVATLMERQVGNPERTLNIVSPYLVPMAEGVAWLRTLVERGVRVRILTNSLASTDVAAVHAGYARWRDQMLDAGVELYEYGRDASRPKSGQATAPGQGGRHRPQGSAGSASGAVSGSGSSESSLHAKIYSVDGRRVYVGSANFDPRSANLNTEFGFVIDSARLTGMIDEAYARDLPSNAWRVRRGEDGRLQWTREVASGTETRDEEPDAPFGRRFGASLFWLLPLDWLL